MELRAPHRRETPTEHDVVPPRGTLIAGRFLADGVLGSGGVGAVVAARHVDLGRPVALKLLRADRRSRRECRERLLREARVTATIVSEHAVRVHDLVRHGPWSPLVVLEYLEGETLAVRLRQGPLDPARAAAIVVQACEAVAEAHRKGVVHRDLKPSNLFLIDRFPKQEFVKVIDFGIAKAQTEFNELTASDALIASPAYASPEQLRASKDVDPRSDVWSLGVILFECLTGTLPFRGSTLAEIASSILRDPPHVGAHALPEAMSAVIDRCLQKDPGLRYEDLRCLVAALEPFAPADAANFRNHLLRIESAGTHSRRLAAHFEETATFATSPPLPTSSGARRRLAVLALSASVAVPAALSRDTSFVHRSVGSTFVPTTTEVAASYIATRPMVAEAHAIGGIPLPRPSAHPIVRHGRALPKPRHSASNIRASAEPSSVPTLRELPLEALLGERP